MAIPIKPPLPAAWFPRGMYCHLHTNRNLNRQGLSDKMQDALVHTIDVANQQRVTKQIRRATLNQAPGIQLGLTDFHITSERCRR
ncbi:hypothetical protein VTJ04DRAFT_5379 [Mycothermus thermophilus]|uniref:uncharacterized protein n=1 Tax=Humicola insolens TaxID=85995 RepID=UPI00374489DF